MLKKLTFRDRFSFFFSALKIHLVLYITGFVFLLGLGGIGLGLLLFKNELDMPSLIFAWAFLGTGIGVFVLIFYLNISSMQYHFNSAIMKKYARYKKMAITDFTHDEVLEDGVIQCFISVNYEGYILTDLFELPIKKKSLLEHLKKKMFISISIAEQLPSAMRISPRKLLKQLEDIDNV